MPVFYTDSSKKRPSANATVSAFRRIAREKFKPAAKVKGYMQLAQIVPFKRKQTVDLDHLQVAKPCPLTWEMMQGDNRVRQCDACDLNVFNIESMSKAEAVRMINEREGRLCIRMKKRADGTVVTRDCPVGLRAYRKRMGKFAAAAVGTVLGLFSISFGQKNDATVKDAASTQTSSRQAPNAGNGTITGVARDPHGAVIPGATIELFKVGSKKSVQKAKTDDNGKYSFDGLKPGNYRIEAAVEGFNKNFFENIVVEDGMAVSLDLKLDLFMTIMVGMIGDPSMIDMTVSGPSPKKVTREDLERIPGRRIY